MIGRRNRQDVQGRSKVRMDKAKTMAMPVALLAFAAIIGVIAVVLVNVSLTSA